MSASLPESDAPGPIVVMTHFVGISSTYIMREPSRWKAEIVIHAVRFAAFRIPHSAFRI